MRLLDTSRIELHEFFDERIPEYAILSHRWEDGEVTFQLFQSREGLEMAGYQKIRNFCAKAASDGWEYVWIDSCCIDKSSSAELSEAINSMYKWYKNAQVCYGYLCDVDIDQDLESALRLSEWFTRGWTLQELLAPKLLEFYDQNWNEIGTKQSLSWLLADITGIERHILSGDNTQWHWSICIAEKMSWAARRKTTRAEDLAYCLMGLFDINMALLYGEGAQKAFIRLQTEIMARTTDESIFAWSFPEKGSRVLPLLAEHPSWFTNCGDLYLLRRGRLFERSSTHQMTSRGVRMEAVRITSMELNQNLHFGEEEGFLMPLNCGRWASSVTDYYLADHRYILAIQMIKTRSQHPDFALDPWHRLPDLALVDARKDGVEHFLKEIIHVPQIKITQPFSRSFQGRTLIRARNLAKYGFTLIDENGWSFDYDQGGLQPSGQNTQGDLILEYTGPEEVSETEYCFLFSNGRVQFALLIRLCLRFSCDLQSGVPEGSQPVRKLGVLKSLDFPFWTSQGGNWDRCSYCVEDSLYVSASLRLGKESGNLVNIVDVTVGRQGLWAEGIRAPV